MRLAKSIRRFGRCKDGSTVVQFAFVAPVLILLSLGIIDMGRLLWMDATIGFAADEGGRYASIHGISGNFPNPPASESDVRNYIMGRVTGISPSDITIDVDWNPDKDSGATVTVELDYIFSFVGLRYIGLSTISLEKTATMTVL